MTLPRPGRVLLVDDNADDNFFHERAILKSGLPLTVSACLDGFSALEHLRDCDAPPDLILLDIHMPRMDGWAFARAFGELPAERRSAVLVVMTTSQPNPADLARVEASPWIRGTVSKPLTPEDVCRLAADHLGAARPES